MQSAEGGGRADRKSDELVDGRGLPVAIDAPLFF
jgi:hypothetical protein